MKLRMILAGMALAILAAPTAGAQTAPVEGGTNVGGYAPSFLELILTPAASGFTTFPKAKTYQMSFNALVTATDPGGTLLTLADGEAATGSKLGHLSSGAKRLPLPLEAKVGSAAFQPLDASVDPLLRKWSDVGTRQLAKVTLAPEGQEQGFGQLPQVDLGHAFV